MYYYPINYGSNYQQWQQYEEHQNREIAKALKAAKDYRDAMCKLDDKHRQILFQTMFSSFAMDLAIHMGY